VRRPICRKCHRFMDKLKQGVDVILLTKFGRGESPQPYQLWKADLFDCEECGAQIVADYASEPYAEHFQKGFSDEVTKAREGGATEVL
jgi:hypothetical protein